jgi:hypothetical protein
LSGGAINPGLSANRDSPPLDGRRIGALLAFCIGMSILVPIAPFSRAVLLDVCCVALLAYKLPSLWRKPEIRTTALLLVFYSGVLAVSTILNGVPLGNLIRRDYGAWFLILEAFGIYVLLREGGYSRHVLVILAVTLGICFHYFYPVDERVYEYPIKFLLGIPLGVLLAVAAAVLARRTALGRQMATVLLLVYAFSCLLGGNRAIGALFFVSAVLINLNLRFVETRRYKAWYPLLLVGGLLAAFAVSELYASLAIAGVFGERQAGIAEYQKQLFGSLLLGGRPEVVINLIAISDSPLIGHGPLAQTPKYMDAFTLLGVYDESFINEEDQALYHSMLFTAGHEAGLFAMVFWAYLVYKLTFAVPIVIRLGRRIAAAVVPFVLNAVWHILFSPLNSYARWQVAIGIALAFYWIDLHRDSVRALPRTRSPARNEAHPAV